MTWPEHPSDRAHLHQAAVEIRASWLDSRSPAVRPPLHPKKALSRQFENFLDSHSTTGQDTTAKMSTFTAAL